MKKSFLDGPKIPGFVQSIKVLLDPLNSLDMWAKKYGETFKLRGDSQSPTIVISNPEDIKVVLSSPSEAISSCEEDPAMKLLIGKDSMMFLDGESHQRKRKMLMPPFHKNNIAGYEKMITNATETVLTSLVPYKHFSVRSVTKQITLEVILKVIFGTNKSSRYLRLKQSLTALNKLFESPVFEMFLAFPLLQKKWGIWSEYLEIDREISRILYEEIQERRSKKVNEKDILGLLLVVTDEVGQPLSDKEIRDELMTLILGGYETTSAALGWALYWVHYFPDVKEKIIKELVSLKEEDEGSSGIVRLSYLDAVVSETLRLYPVAIGTFSRRTKKSLQLQAHHIDPGTRIHISIYLAHRRAEVYPDPEKFKPERFLERQFSPYEYLPFGGGERRCLGATLAQFEMKVVLATILKKQMDLAIVNNKPLKPVRHGIALVPPTGFEMVINRV